MFRKSSASSTYLLGQGSCASPEKEAALTGFEPMAPLANLVYYAAVARGSIILAEFTAGNADLAPMAARCLANLPPLHSRFSYTTRQRRFICLIEDPFVYCAIMDEALCKGDAFAFLQRVRDAAKSLWNGHLLELESLTHHAFDKELVPIIRRLAAPMIGLPQKERNRIEEELQAQRELETDLEVSSPSAVAPLHEMSDQVFDSKTEEKPLGVRSPRMPFIGRGKKDKKVKEELNEVKEIMMDNKGEAMDKRKKLEIMVEGVSATAENPGSLDKDAARRMWWHNVKLVILLDIFVCLVLLSIWLGVCRGIACLRRN